MTRDRGLFLTSYVCGFLAVYDTSSEVLLLFRLISDKKYFVRFMSPATFFSIQHKAVIPRSLHVVITLASIVKCTEGFSPEPLLYHVLLLSPVASADKSDRDGYLLEVCLDVLHGHLHWLVDGSAETNLCRTAPSPEKRTPVFAKKHQQKQ